MFSFQLLPMVNRIFFRCFGMSCFVCIHVVNWFSILWKSNQSDNIKPIFPRSDRVDSTMWMHSMDADLTYREQARRDLHKNAASHIEQTWKQHFAKQQLYGHLTSCCKPIQIIRTRLQGNKDGLISNVFLWTPSNWRVSVGQPTKTYL